MSTTSPILDHPRITSRYFFPRSTATPEPAFPVTAADGSTLACVWHAPHPHGRTMVHFHGNGEVVSDWCGGGFARWWVNQGWNVCFAEYRGYGASTGSPALAAMLDDVEAIAEALGLPDEQVVVFGRSVGSIYAIEWAARRPGIAGLILESGIASPLERILLRVHPSELGVQPEALEAEAARLLDHRAKLGRTTCPLLVLHAAGDDLVTPDHAQRNHGWANSTMKELILFEAGDHNSILVANLEQYTQAVGRFLRQLMTSH
ncbi:MAG: alpha/beta fold hydrolase [Myxococcota bacterium]